MKLIFNLFLLAGCTGFNAVTTQQLNAKNLAGHWTMSISPYYLDIDCSASLSFLRPTTTILYGDQIGSGYIISEINENEIITGPLIRSSFKIDEWPTESDGQIRMTVDGRHWFKSKSIDCK